MEISQAQLLGAQAFKAGKARAPALNPSFIDAAHRSGNLAELLDAYLHGWTIAMLAERAPLSRVPAASSCSRRAHENAVRGH